MMIAYAYRLPIALSIDSAFRLSRAATPHWLLDSP